MDPRAWGPVTILSPDVETSTLDIAVAEMRGKALRELGYEPISYRSTTEIRCQDKRRIR